MKRTIAGLMAIAMILLPVASAGSGVMDGSANNLGPLAQLAGIGLGTLGVGMARLAPSSSPNPSGKEGDKKKGPGRPVGSTKAAKAVTSGNPLAGLSPTQIKALSGEQLRALMGTGQAQADAGMAAPMVASPADIRVPIQAPAQASKPKPGPPVIAVAQGTGKEAYSGPEGVWAVAKRLVTNGTPLGTPVGIWVSVKDQEGEGWALLCGPLGGYGGGRIGSRWSANDIQEGRLAALQVAALESLKASK